MPDDSWVSDKKKEEVEKYQGLKRQTDRIGRREKCDNCTFDCSCFGSII